LTVATTPCIPCFGRDASASREPAGEEAVMPKYLFTGSYTGDGARGVLAEGGTGRRAATEQLVKSLGGAVEAYYFAFGGEDFYLIADLPSNAAAAAASLTASSSGALGTRTVVLLTPEEVDDATKLSPSYRPPGR
jgi:uncharacterized protein with GYD domain